METLKGTVAVVTGGARGIGRAIAEELGRYEATVVVNYAHSQEAAEELVARLRQDGSPEAIALHANVSDKAQAQQLIDATIQRFGRLDVLVNNAGITRDRTLKKMAAEDWDQVIQTDLSSDFYTVKAALPCLMQQESGRIINISSYNLHCARPLGGIDDFSLGACSRGGRGDTMRWFRRRNHHGAAGDRDCPVGPSRDCGWRV